MKPVLLWRNEHRVSPRVKEGRLRMLKVVGDFITEMQAGVPSEVRQGK